MIQLAFPIARMLPLGAFVLPHAWWLAPLLPAMATGQGVVRSLARNLVNDAQALRTGFAHMWRARASQPIIRRYMETHQTRALHLGAGGNVFKDWLNTDLEPSSPDIAFLDVTERLPFPDNSLDFVYNEHLFEHLTHRDGMALLQECFRVLKPNGRVRVATPDLQFLIDIYTQPNHTETQAKYIKRILQRAFPEHGFYDGAFVLNHFVRHWGHKFIYDERTLGGAIERAGFVNAKRWDVGNSDQPMLENIEHHGDAISDEFNLLQTIVFEGTKPSPSQQR